MALAENALAALIFTAATAVCSAGKPPTVQVGPGVFRSQAKWVVTPIYPQQSVRAGHSGVAVADVHVTTRGVVESVKLLQAPDAAIGSELIRAVLSWTFHPLIAMPDKTPVESEGRVMFMFSLTNGVPQVTDLVGTHVKLDTKRNPGPAK